MFDSALAKNQAGLQLCVLLRAFLGLGGNGINAE